MCKEAQRVDNESSKSQHFSMPKSLHRSSCLHFIFLFARIQFRSNHSQSKFRLSSRISVNVEAKEKKSHFIIESKPFEWFNVHKLCCFFYHGHSFSVSKKGAGVLIRHRSRILWFVSLSTCFTTLKSTHFSSLFFSSFWLFVGYQFPFHKNAMQHSCVYVQRNNMFQTRRLMRTYERKLHVKWRVKHTYKKN